MTVPGSRNPAGATGGERVLVTGSSGRLGRAVVADLLGAGHQVVGADRAPLATETEVEFVAWDGRDVEVLAAGLVGCTGLVHLAAIPQPVGHPAEVVFGNNTGATFAALQAASRVGLRRAVIASSVSIYGMPWSPSPIRAQYVPVDEEHPMLNYDPYGLSKEVDERTAQMFCRRDEMSVAALRFHWLATREEQLDRVEKLRSDTDWPTQLREMWGYVDVRDAARACRLALERARDRPFGFLPLNIVAADALTEQPVAALLAAHAPDVELRGGAAELRSAFAIDRASSAIGWRPLHSWRD
jgi:nucleoside-diphosphate-sugar epimerase